MNWLHRFMVYLGRHRIIMDRDGNGPYLSRYYIFLKDRGEFLFNIFIHKFLQSDPHDLHDHPWNYISIPLWPGYWEYTSENSDYNELTMENIIKFDQNNYTLLSNEDKDDKTNSDKVDIDDKTNSDKLIEDKINSDKVDKDIEDKTDSNKHIENKTDSDKVDKDIVMVTFDDNFDISTNSSHKSKLSSICSSTESSSNSSKSSKSTSSNSSTINLSTSSNSSTSTTIPQKCEWRGPLSIRYRKAESLHRIELPNQGYCWTIFIPLKRCREWGFQTKNGWISEEKYKK